VLLATCRGNHWFEKKKVRRFKKKVQEEGSRSRFKKKKTPKDTERHRKKQMAQSQERQRQ
jgi:hypothetical protein